MDLLKVNMKKFNIFTLVSLLLLLGGIIFYIYWGVRFGVWHDIGIYSITIVLVLGGILGTVVSLWEKPKEQS